jgi:hypothetical protein
MLTITLAVLAALGIAEVLIHHGALLSRGDQEKS